MNKTIWGNGFQLTPAAMEFLQNEFTDAIGGIVGDASAASYVVSGCAVSGGVRQNGWVVVRGEIMPFVANTLSTDYLQIKQTVTQNMYSTGSPENALYTRYAECVENSANADAVFSQMPVLRRTLKPQPTEWAELTGITSVSTAENYLPDINWGNSCHVMAIETGSKRWRIDENGDLLVTGVLSLSNEDASALTYFCPIPRKVKFRCDAMTSDWNGKALYSVFATIDTDGALYLDADDFANPQSRHAITKLLFPMTVIPL